VHVQRVVFETPANMGRGMHRRHALLKLRDLQIDGLPRLVRRKKNIIAIVGLLQHHTQCEQPFAQPFFLCQVNCCVMKDLTPLEEFVFSERANNTVHKGSVKLTIYDQFIMFDTLRNHR
jgi:hypothetical protein